MTPAQLAALTTEEREMWALCEAATPTRWAYEEQAEAIRTALPAALETIANLRANLAAANRQIAELAEELYQTRIQRGEAQAERDWAREERETLRAELARVTQERDYHASISENP